MSDGDPVKKRESLIRLSGNSFWNRKASRIREKVNFFQQHLKSDESIDLF